MIIVNNSFNDYSNLSELDRSEFDVIITNSIQFEESVDVFKIGELSEHGFGIVKDIQYSINTSALIWSEFFDYVNQLTGISIDELNNKSMLDLIQFRNYLVAEIKRINEIESILLTHSSTDEEIEANLEEFEVFGAYIQFRSLANNDITKIEAVRKIKYSLCLTELRLRVLEREYQDRLNDIYKRKNRL